MLQNAFGNWPLSLIEIVALFFFIWYINDLYQKVSWQWPAAGVVVTVILAFVFPLLNLGRYVETVLITSEVLSFLLSYTLLSKKIKEMVSIYHQFSNYVCMGDSFDGCSWSFIQYRLMLKNSFNLYEKAPILESI